MKTFLIVLVLILSMFTAISVTAQQSSNETVDIISNPHDKRAEAICEEIYKSTNALVPFTKTLCAPSKGEKKGSLSLLLFTTDRVTKKKPPENFGYRSALLLSAVMRKHHNNVIVDKIVLLDKELSDQIRVLNCQ